MTLPTQSLDPGVPKAPKPKQITGEKTLLYKNVQMGDMSSLNFSRLAPGPGWLVVHKRKINVFLIDLNSI